MDENKKARIAEFSEAMRTIMSSGDEKAMEELLDFTTRALTRAGADKTDIEFIKISIACAAAPEADRVRMHAVLADMMEMAFLFQSDPPTIEMYTGGEGGNPLVGHAAEAVFKRGEDIAGRTGCGHHAAMRSILMGYVIGRQLRHIKDRLRARGIDIPNP